jgi:DNA-binding Xre family transcriptional regulator
MRNIPYKPSRTYLREWREHREMTQTKLADASEITKCHFWRIENRHVALTQRILDTFARVLQTTPGDILSYPPGADDETTPSTRT